MAGHGPEVLKADPALTHWSNMSVNRYKYFRWTGRTALINIMYVLAVPSIFGYVAWRTDGKYEMRGKLRGDTVSEF